MDTFAASANRIRKAAVQFAERHWRYVYETREAAQQEADRLRAQCADDDDVRVLALPYDLPVSVLAAEPCQFPTYEGSDDDASQLLLYIEDVVTADRAKLVTGACEYAQALVEALNAFLKPARVEHE